MKLSVKHILWGVILFEVITAYLVGVGVWPQTVAWLSLGLVAIFILAADPFESLLLSIASIPFYLVLPNPYFDSFSTWRLVFAWLFGIWVLKTLYKHYRVGDLKTLPQLLKTRLFTWDKYLILFAGIAWLSVLLARFPGQSVRQILFLINISFIYFVATFVVNTKQKLLELIKYTTISLGFIVVLGYVQFASTLFSEQYYFWQYWALLVSKAYYGLGLANVLIYSNSWFSYTGGQPTLRMFSIMPDSHSFGVVCIFLIAFLTAYLSSATTTARKVWLWVAIGFTSWALILSGTRGVWVGMLAPVLVAIIMYWKKLARFQAKQFLISALLIVIVFATSPILVRGLNLIRNGLGGGSYLQRVSSIYDLEEQSNAGRLVIWKDSMLYSLRHPLGVGYGNFIVSIIHDINPEDKYEDLGSKKNLRYNLPQKFVTAHSLYLNILVELGLVGLAIFGLLWLSYAKKAWQFLAQHRTTKNLLTGMAASGSLVLLWLLAYGAFDLTLFNDKVLAYTFLILCIGGLIFRHYKEFSGTENH